MYFTGLQNISHFKYYPKSNFRKKSFMKLNLTFKKSYGQATFKQNWIKISCLFNYMTDFLSPFPFLKKPHVETELQIRILP